jgi:ABC-type bacteriocin/lantibiotic exporter with double-glycine peptidase domain
MSRVWNRMKAVNARVHGLFLLAAALCAGVCGCAGTTFADLRSGRESRGHYIEGVPFFRQGEYDCGPAALASVLSYWGALRSVEEITARVYTPKLRGTLPLDMERFVKEAGFAVESSAGTASLESIRSFLRVNHPVICLLDLGFGPYKQPHYIVIIGYDDVHALVIMHDGKTPNRLMSYKKFDQAWSRAGRWMMVVKPEKEGKNVRR